MICNRLSFSHQFLDLSLSPPPLKRGEEPSHSRPLISLAALLITHAVLSSTNHPPLPPTLRRLLLTPLPLFLPYFLFRSIPAFERKNIIYIYFWNSVFIIIIAEQKNSIFYKIIPFRIFKFSFPLQWDIYYRVLNPFTFKFLCWTESEEIVKRELSPSVKKLRGWFINGKLKKNRELIHIYITKIIIYNIY